MNVPYYCFTSIISIIRLFIIYINSNLLQIKDVRHFIEKTGEKKTRSVSIDSDFACMQLKISSIQSLAQIDIWAEGLLSAWTIMQIALLIGVLLFDPTNLLVLLPPM